MRASTACKVAKSITAPGHPRCAHVTAASGLPHTAAWRWWIRNISPSTAMPRRSTWNGWVPMARHTTERTPALARRVRAGATAAAKPMKPAGSGVVAGPVRITAPTRRALARRTYELSHLTSSDSEPAPTPGTAGRRVAPRPRRRTPARARLVQASAAVAARPARPLSPVEQPREANTAAPSAVVVGPRAARGTSARRPNAAPVRGTRERKAVRVGEALPETPRPRRASRPIRHEVDDGATPSRPTWDPGRDFARVAALAATRAPAPALTNGANSPRWLYSRGRCGGRGEAGNTVHARRATA